MPQKRGGSKNTKRESTRETLFNLPASPSLHHLLEPERERTPQMPEASM